MVIFHSYVKLPEGTLKLMGKSMENHFFFTVKHGFPMVFHRENI